MARRALVASGPRTDSAINMVSLSGCRVADMLTVQAAMPSLHFGYSLMIGITIMTIPLAPRHRRSRSVHLTFFNRCHPELAPHFMLPSARRAACVLVGFLYPFSILVAIVSTANHFILDAVAGAMVCFIGWKSNAILLNLLPLEDYFLWCVRIHKPVQQSLQPYEFGGKYQSWKPSGTVVVER